MATTTKKPPEQIIKETCGLIQSFGFEWIHAEFDGSGDSGNLDTFYVYEKVPSDRAHSVERNYDTRQSFAAFKQNCSANAPTPAQATRITAQLDAFERAVWNLLPAGFEINDGSYGEIEINTVTKKIHMVVNERISDVNTYERDFE